jgi:hypothetical protein
MKSLDFSMDLALGSTQPLTEMSTEAEGRLANNGDNLIAICELIV